MKKKRNYCSERGWLKHGGQILRFLSFTSYEPCYYGEFPREFLFRLCGNDPRPRGRHWKGSERISEWYANLPFGQWIEVVPVEAVKEAA
ncbi:MAG: hypothetical protein M0Z71_12510 [Nitrospiraceae bacterium]|nr:hypothetical protein [Nitrospiraceae bacterium]